MDKFINRDELLKYIQDEMYYFGEEYSVLNIIQDIETFSYSELDDLLYDECMRCENEKYF